MKMKREQKQPDSVDMKVKRIASFNTLRINYLIWIIRAETEYKRNLKSESILSIDWLHNLI